MIAGRFGHEGLCQLRTELSKSVVVQSLMLHVAACTLVHKVTMDVFLHR